MNDRTLDLPINSTLARLRSMGLLLLCSAEDEDEELTALLVLHLAYRKPFPMRYGPRGRYDMEKSVDFCDGLLTCFSDRMFKVFCWYVSVFSWFACKE
jgi:hypothetical protein